MFLDSKPARGVCPFFVVCLFTCLDLFPFSLQSARFWHQIWWGCRVLLGYVVLTQDGCPRWSLPPFLEELKSEAKAQGLWNLWLPADTAESIQDLVRDVRIKADADILLGPGLSNLEYAHLSEIMGACLWASEVFNCSSPDTGNMEILARYQDLKYLLFTFNAMSRLISPTVTIYIFSKTLN